MAEDLSMSNAFYKQLAQAVEANLENEQFGVEELALEVGLSRSQIHRKLRSLTGQSVSQFIREIRLQRAHEMLQDQVGTASEIAYKVGFGSPTYFSTCFHEYYGYPPGEVKKEKLADQAKRRTEEPFAQSNSSSRRRFTYVVFGIPIILILAYSLYKFYSTEEQVAQTVNPEVADKSIMVLPFTDTSPGQDQKYFCDGMLDAILNHLTKIPDLRVISRTTSVSYRNTPKTIPEIGIESGVAYILEGGVQHSNDKVRITVQLIDVNTDQHLWSESYDRNFNDVFAIQSDVAQRVAASLQAQVHPEVKVRIETQPTASMEAYSLYLQGRFYLYNNVRFEECRGLFERAIDLDPEFAMAHTSLGYYWLVKGNYLGDVESQSAMEQALPPLRKAIDIDDQLAEAHNILSRVYLWFGWDFESAEQQRVLVAELNPDQERPNVWVVMATGRFKEALEIMKKVAATHPLDWWSWSTLAQCYALNGQFEEAFEAQKRHEQLLLNPVQAKGRIRYYSGMYEAAIEIVESVFKTYFETPPMAAAYLALSYYQTDQRGKTDLLLDELKKKAMQSSAGSPSFFIAMIYAQMEEIDTAFEWLDKAYEDHELEMYSLKVEPPFKPLRNDPRWQEMLDKMGFPE